MQVLLSGLPSWQRDAGVPVVGQEPAGQGLETVALWRVPCARYFACKRLSKPGA